VLDQDGQVKPRAAAAQALVTTPTDDELPRRYADFATMTEALDYVAQGKKGMNFHDARATLARVYPYAELREDAIRAAHRLKARGIQPGERVALIAETAAVLRVSPITVTRDWDLARAWLARELRGTDDA